MARSREGQNPGRLDYCLPVCAAVLGEERQHANVCLYVRWRGPVSEDALGYPFGPRNLPGVPGRGEGQLVAVEIRMSGPIHHHAPGSARLRCGASAGLHQLLEIPPKKAEAPQDLDRGNPSTRREGIHRGGGEPQERGGFGGSQDIRLLSHGEPPVVGAPTGLNKKSPAHARRALLLLASAPLRVAATYSIAATSNTAPRILSRRFFHHGDGDGACAPPAGAPPGTASASGSGQIVVSTEILQGEVDFAFRLRGRAQQGYAAKTDRDAEQLPPAPPPGGKIAPDAEASE